MQKNYFNEMERKDAQILRAFNDDVKFFSELTYNDLGSKIDATAKTKRGKKCHIEIKQRTGERYGDFKKFIEQFDTIFLATSKIDAFSKIISSGYSLNEKELFVSIFDDGDTIIIHDVLKPQQIEWLPNQRLWNPGTKQWDYEHRLGFYWQNGIIYTKQKDGHYKRWTKEDYENQEEYVIRRRENMIN